MSQKALLSVFVISFLVLVCADTAFAGIGVTPTKLELRLKEGSSEKGEWTVVNTSDKLVKVDIGIEDWLKIGYTESSIKDPKNWLKVKPEEFFLNSGEKKEVQYTVKAPKGLVGEAAAMIFFSSTEVGAAPSMIKPRFGVILYLISKGTEKLDIVIKDIIVLKHKTVKRQDGKGIVKNMKLDVNIKNNGNVHIRPYGEIDLQDINGRGIRKLTMPYGWPVLPGRERVYSVFAKDVMLEAGKYKAIVKIEFGDLYEKKEELLREVNFSVDEQGSITVN